MSPGNARLGAPGTEREDESSPREPSGGWPTQAAASPGFEMARTRPMSLLGLFSEKHPRATPAVLGCPPAALVTEGRTWRTPAGVLCHPKFPEPPCFPSDFQTILATGAPQDADSCPARVLPRSRSVRGRCRLSARSHRIRPLRGVSRVRLFSPEAPGGSFLSVINLPGS